MEKYTIILVAVLVGLYVLHKFVLKKPAPASSEGGGGVPVVYGSMRCPHTVKLRETIGKHDFYDCDSNKCPEFVEAFPTTVYPDGSTRVGAA